MSRWNVLPQHWITWVWISMNLPRCRVRKAPWACGRSQHPRVDTSKDTRTWGQAGGRWAVGRRRWVAGPWCRCLVATCLQGSRRPFSLHSLTLNYLHLCFTCPFSLLMKFFWHFMLFSEHKPFPLSVSWQFFIVFAWRCFKLKFIYLAIWNRQMLKFKSEI